MRGGLQVKFEFQNLQEEKEPELMIIPMIDIIFFLLVFFMLSTLSMTEQNQVQIQLPQAASSQVQIEKSIDIAIVTSGSVLIDQETIPLGLLRKRIAIELEKNPDSSFILRGNKELPYEEIVNVLDEMKLAGAKRIAIGTEKR